MKNPVFVLLAMIFCHIVDDYYLQRILSSLKQKIYWEENYPNKLYKHDYIVALITHGFSWSFMIMLPIFILVNFKMSISMVIFFIANMLIHAFIDNLKANKMRINLFTDQRWHLYQIIITWSFYYAFL